MKENYTMSKEEKKKKYFKKYNKEYREKNKEYFKKYLIEWRKNHPNYFKRMFLWRDKYYFGGNREKVLKRDGWRCVICGSALDIVVHHIDGNGRGKTVEKMNNNMDNLISLCHSCHSKIHNNKEYREKTESVLKRHRD